MLLRWHPRKGLIKGCWTRFDTKFASNRATIHTPFNIANRRYPNIFFTGQQLYMIIYLDMISHVAPVPEVDFHHVYPKVLEVPKVAFLGKSLLYPLQAPYHNIPASHGLRHCGDRGGRSVHRRGSRGGHCWGGRAGFEGQLLDGILQFQGTSSPGLPWFSP